MGQIKLELFNNNKQNNKHTGVLKLDDFSLIKLLILASILPSFLSNRVDRYLKLGFFGSINGDCFKILHKLEKH